MFAKIEISGNIETVTGLHIGGSSAFSAIGAVDSPVILDARTGMPMIPGSSLKGKMRALLARRYNQRIAENPDNDAECLTSLFGSTRKGGRILFSDMFLGNMDELHHDGLTGATEIKFENSIKRTTADATPRQIERVVRGAVFPIHLVYEVTDESTEEQILQDFEVLKEGFRLLEYDYLGGNGSRGYGRVKIRDLQVEVLIGDVEGKVLDKCQEILN